MASIALTQSSPATRTRFVLTIFAGSFLLFLVQPMIARMALPRLGGAPSVWNSAMLVYQALLLAGYAYAHWLSGFAPKRQAFIHLALFAAAALMLPIGLTAAMPPPEANPFVWVPWLLLTSIGPLFFVISAQAPLMQRWFTLSDGGDPYPLYAASNLGSFGGLIAYPLLVEPLLPVAEQSLIWSIAFAALALLVGWCALALPRTNGVAIETTAALPPSWRQIAVWIGLAAIPSGLMLSTSLHLTTDIVAMPLLWVVPLGLYLLSFSVAFASNRQPAELITRTAPLFLLIAACGVFVDTTFLPWVFAAAAVISLFTLSVALHSAMYDRRPDPAYLTRFYLAMSVGGVLGGLFCALIAPLVFDWAYEHPILMLAAALVLAPPALFAVEPPKSAVGTIAAVIIVFMISQVGQGAYGLPESHDWSIGASYVLIAISLLAIGNRWLFAACLAAVMLSIGGWDKLGLSFAEGKMTRSYFGIYSIRDGRTSRILVHGTTVHGIQNRGSVQREMMPTSYYAPLSGVGTALRAAPALFGPAARIHVVGLGTGTLSCYARPGQDWRFYEIDPVIVGIASDPKAFTFLSHCLPNPRFALGDARLTLAREPAASADVLVVDAFSSDSVPMHLLTTEAFDTYRRHIRPSGLLMVHISNRYLDLKPLVAAAAAHGWHARLRWYKPNRDEMNQNYSGSIWVALSPSAATINRLTASDPNVTWEALPPKAGFKAWTDGHASILPILKWAKD